MGKVVKLASWQAGKLTGSQASNSVTKEEAQDSAEDRKIGSAVAVKKPCPLTPAPGPCRLDFPHRKAMLAKVHIATKDLRICTICSWFAYTAGCPKCKGTTRPITELDYRAWLKRLWGKTTAADLTEFELQGVIYALRSVGFVPTKKAGFNGRKSNKGMARAAEDRAKLILGDHWKARLNGWIRKVFKVESAYFLTSRQLRAVFAFIEGVRKETGDPF